METVSDFIFVGSKITEDGDCSHEIKIRLLLALLLADSLLIEPKPLGDCGLRL